MSKVKMTIEIEQAAADFLQHLGSMVDKFLNVEERTVEEHASMILSESLFLLARQMQELDQPASLEEALKPTDLN